MYVRSRGGVIFILVLYVDDILLIGNDIPTLNSVKSWLGKSFFMKDLGKAAYILGINICRDRSRGIIGLSKITYLDKMLKNFKMEEYKNGFVPLQCGTILSKT